MQQNISLADFFFKILPEKKKTHTRIQRALSQTQIHSHTLRLRLCEKETDLPRLTQVQMSQCGWISFGIVSAPSFDKEVFLSPRPDMILSSGLRSPRQHGEFAERTRVNPLN